MKKLDNFQELGDLEELRDLDDFDLLGDLEE